MPEYGSGHGSGSGSGDRPRRQPRRQPQRQPQRQPPYDLSPRAPGSRPLQDDLRYWSPRPQQPPRPDRPDRPERPERPARTERTEHRQPRRRRRATVAARALACTASAVIVLASAATWAAYHNLTSGLLTSDAINEIRSGEKGYVAPHLDGSVNLLLVGLDSRKDMNGNDLPTDFVEQELHAGSSDIGGYNTNVLMFMHIPADGGRVTAFSIPRDDYVEEPGGASAVGDIPDLGMHKIKEAYGRAKAIAVDRLKASGMTDKAQIEKISREVGRESTLRTVQLLTGEHVDHLAEVNLLGFYDVAKAVGPIEVCLNHPVDDPIENGAGTGLKLPAGHSMLDAATALQFVRQRFHLLRGDFDRNRRQQAFLASVLHKLKTEGVVGDLGKMQALLDVVKKDVVIDDSWDVLDFAARAQNLTGGDADFRELPITGQPVLPGDGSVNTVNPLQIRQIVMTGFGDAKEFENEMTQAAANGGYGYSGQSQGQGQAQGRSQAQALGPGGPADPGSALGPGQTDAGLPSQTRLPAPASDGAGLPQDSQYSPLTPLPPLPSAVRGAGTGMRPAAVAPTDTHAVIDLYNATAHSGLAVTVGDWLAASGWPVDKTGGATAQNQTTIFYGRGAAKAAGQVAQALGVAAVPAPSARTAAGHVLIRLGADYAPPGGPQPVTPDDSAGADTTDPTSPTSPTGSTSPTDSTGSTGSTSQAGQTDPSSADPPGTPGPADSPGIAMDNGITCVN